jgi:hypothetical protein
MPGGMFALFGGAQFSSYQTQQLLGRLLGVEAPAPVQLQEGEGGGDGWWGALNSVVLDFLPQRPPHFCNRCGVQQHVRVVRGALSEKRTNRGGGAALCKRRRLSNSHVDNLAGWVARRGGPAVVVPRAHRGGARKQEVTILRARPPCVRGQRRPPSTLGARAARKAHCGILKGAVH